jgi:hypothetical protein
MKAYIKNSTAISPQLSFLKDFPWEKPHKFEHQLTCQEPVYKDFFPPMKIRRMSRLVKMALTTAKVCLDKIGIEMPDAIISASGWGCLNDTYKYLGEITDKDIASPSPATFIQSTHNTPGGQIALTLGCQQYNNVIVNGTTSFELALIDALMLINEGKENVLVGGFDEIAEADYQLKKQAGYWKSDDITSANFIQHNSEGTLPGEGAGFFVLGPNANESKSFINSCQVMHCPPKYEPLKEQLEKLLAAQNLKLDDIDIVLSGANGDNRIMPLYNDLYKHVFRGSTIIDYKQLCGEYDTSSAFALCLADNILGTQLVPDYLANNWAKHKPLKNILIYNYANENKHAITLISKTNF